MTKNKRSNNKDNKTGRSKKMQDQNNIKMCAYIVEIDLETSFRKFVDVLANAKNQKD